MKDLQREGVVQVVATEEDQRREDFPEVPTSWSSWVRRNPRVYRRKLPGLGRGVGTG